MKNIAEKSVSRHNSLMNESRLFPREKYLRRVRPFYHDTGMIKVFTGVRRCGKSSLMMLVQEELRASGVPENAIISINLDRRPYKGISKADALEKAIDRLSSGIDGIKYLFIDEVQNAVGFESSINAYREEGDFSIFITGSNSYMLSGELVTKLTGRYIEIDMTTLTFDEYLAIKEFYGRHMDGDLMNELRSYITEGGFPHAILYDSQDARRTYTQSVVDEIFEKDIKHNRRIRKKHLFDLIMQYLINNFGCTVSSTRFDLKSKQSLNGGEKYYLSDLSFYFMRNTDNRIPYGPVLENIVYQYAKSLSYSVSIGKIGKLEVDFIMRSPRMDYAYVQVAMSIFNDSEGKTEEREYRSLESIRDSYPKYLLTLDPLQQHRNGIIHANLAEFIKEENPF